MYMIPIIISVTSELSCASARLRHMGCHSFYQAAFALTVLAGRQCWLKLVTDILLIIFMTHYGY